MPWEVLPVSELRTAFVHEVRTLQTPVSVACEKFNISRKTGYKWLARYAELPGVPLVDRSRRPASSPNKTASDIEQAVLDVRARFHWGPRKTHAFLKAQGRELPSARTVASILKRRGCIQEEEKIERLRSRSSAPSHTNCGSAITKGRSKSRGRKLTCCR